MISGLAATGAGVAGTAYTDDFTVTPPASTVLASGDGCTLSAASSTGVYTLTVTRSDPGRRTCTVSAVHTAATTATAAIDFVAAPVISGLAATDSGVAGTAYTDDFTVTPPASTVLASGDGCTLSAASSTGVYTLTVTRSDPGRRTCTVSAVHTAATTATVTIDFTPPTTPTPTATPTPTPTETPTRLAAPSGFGCSWITGRSEEVKCLWQSVAGDASYEVEYKVKRRGTVMLSWKSSVSTAWYSIGLPSSADEMSARVRATRSGETSSYTPWATALKPPPAPVWVSVSCSDSGDLNVLWTKVDGAVQYRLTIGISGRSTTAQTDTKYIPDIPRANPPTNDSRTGTVDARYTITVAATRDGTSWSAESPSDADACSPVAPPKPTGVTATCADRTLTVNWNTAGEGLAKATAYKPRIFIGASTTPDPRWTANAAGHDTTSATIPAQGEHDLPDTGVFQVRVKAANTAGDSDWSDPVKATCGPPGTVTGLKCTAITKDQITIEWNTAVGAQNYKLIIAPTPTGTSQPPLSIAALQQEKQSYTFEGLTSGHLHRIAVQPTNTKLGPTATLECTTLDNNWLQAECSGSGILRVRWDDPSGSQTAPSGYAGTITLVSDLLDGLVASYDEAYDNRVTSVEWGAIGASGAKYQVYVKSKNANGGPVYSQTKSFSCPALSAPDYNGPNVPENLSSLEKIVARIAIGVLSQNSGYGAVNASKLFFGGAKYVLDQVSRNCSTAHETASGVTTKTCDEVWNEYITVRLDESSLDETLTTVVDAIVPDDEVELVGQLVGRTFAMRVLWGKIKEKGAKKIAAKITARSGALVGLETFAVWLYYEGTAPYAEINGKDNCVFDQPEGRGDDIKNWTAVKKSLVIKETVGKVKHVRNVVVHYCKESE